MLISTSGPLIPSSPRCQCTPSSAIQGVSTWLPSRAAELSTYAQTDQANVTRPPSTAIADGEGPAPAEQGGQHREREGYGDQAVEQHRRHASTPASTATAAAPTTTTIR